MREQRLAAITIGQSPRTDITSDITGYLSGNIRLVEYGALDPYTIAEVEAQFRPNPENEILVSRMRDGTPVKLDGSLIPGLVQNCVDQAESDGADGILLLCTGTFQELRHDIPVIIPQPILHAAVRHIAREQTVGVITPDQAQIEQVTDWWKRGGVTARVVYASPYGDVDTIINAANELKLKDVALICLDCMGYTVEMKRQVAEATRMPVILPRTLVARVADELFGL